MERNLARQLVGLSVKISRHDGRVHHSTVKSVDNVTSTVMVEWYERGICRGKEIDLSDLCALNPDLEDNVNQVVTKTAAPAPVPEKKYEGRLRSSRIPTPSASSALVASSSEENVTRSTQARQTCLFQPPTTHSDPCPTKESPANSETFCTDPPSAKVLTNSAVSNQLLTRNTLRHNILSPVCETSKGNDEARNLHSVPLSAGKSKRKSVALPELYKGNKRLSNMAKPPDYHTKRGKFNDFSRPNQKFYEMIQDFRETLTINPVSVADMVESRRICVCVRKRPLNKQEVSRKEIDVISVPGQGALLVHEPKQKVDLTKYLENQVFQFDYSFDEAATNDLVYRFTAKPLVQSIFEGGMATCFAYGQTGSGKTHTMGGDFTGKQQNSSKGIYALAAQDVFTLLNHQRYASANLLPYVTFFEIYNGKVYDLLNKKAKLRVLEDDRQQVQVVGLEEVFVSTAEQVIKLIEAGAGCRTSGQTSVNANSSRSHAILQIVLRRNDRAATLHGKFSLVDLAGNERGTDVRGNDRNTLVETAEINRSLLALKECIRSLGRNCDHIPFRMSTLTKVLRDSFVGQNSRTCMIAMVSPGMASCDYTMNTLRYADRVKELNSLSKGNGLNKAQEPSDSSSEEDLSVDPTVIEAISKVTQLEEKLHAEFQECNELVKAMEETSFDIETELPDLMNHGKKLMETLLALQSAINQERAARMTPSCR